MSAFFTSDPVQATSRIARLKYFLLSQGVGIPSFHASEDSQRVRNQVFDQLANLENVSAHTLWLEKSELPSESRSASTIYEMMGLELARIATAEVMHGSYKSLVMVYDKTLIYKEEQAFLSKAKGLLSQLNYPFHVYFHNVSKDFNGQIADYIAWSHYVALERRELRPFEALPIFLRRTNVRLNVSRYLKG